MKLHIFILLSVTTLIICVPTPQNPYDFDQYYFGEYYPEQTPAQEEPYGGGVYTPTVPDPDTTVPAPAPAPAPDPETPDDPTTNDPPVQDPTEPDDPDAPIYTFDSFYPTDAGPPSGPSEDTEPIVPGPPAPEEPAPEEPTPEVPAPEEPSPEVPAPAEPSPEEPSPEEPSPEEPVPQPPAPPGSFDAWFANYYT